MWFVEGMPRKNLWEKIIYAGRYWTKVLDLKLLTYIIDVQQYCIVMGGESGSWTAPFWPKDRAILAWCLHQPRYLKNPLLSVVIFTLSSVVAFVFFCGHPVGTCLRTASSRTLSDRVSTLPRTPIEATTLSTSSTCYRPILGSTFVTKIKDSEAALDTN